MEAAAQTVSRTVGDVHPDLGRGHQRRQMLLNLQFACAAGGARRCRRRLPTQQAQPQRAETQRDKSSREGGHQHGGGRASRAWPSSFACASAVGAARTCWRSKSTTSRWCSRRNSATCRGGEFGCASAVRDTRCATERCAKIYACAVAVRSLLCAAVLCAEPSRAVTTSCTVLSLRPSTPLRAAGSQTVRRRAATHTLGELNRVFGAAAAAAAANERGRPSRLDKDVLDRPSEERVRHQPVRFTLLQSELYPLGAPLHPHSAEVQVADLAGTHADTDT